MTVVFCSTMEKRYVNEQMGVKVVGMWYGISCKLRVLIYYDENICDIDKSARSRSTG